MYLCNCKGITEREIEGAVELGCASVADLTRDLGVGSCCGKCVPDARKLLTRSGVENHGPDGLPATIDSVADSPEPAAPPLAA